MTVKSLSEIMKPDTVGSTAGCETCGNDTKTTVTRVALETLEKLSGKKPAPTAQPVQVAAPVAPAKTPQGNQPQGNQPNRQADKKNG